MTPSIGGHVHDDKLPDAKRLSQFLAGSHKCREKRKNETTAAAPFHGHHGAPYPALLGENVGQ